MHLPMFKPTVLATFIAATLPAEAGVGRYFFSVDMFEGGQSSSRNLKHTPGISNESAVYETEVHQHEQLYEHSFNLKAQGYRVKGYHTVELSWFGANSKSLDVYREGKLIKTIENNGNFIDSLNAKTKGASYTYELCEAKTVTCSNHVTYTF